MTTALVAEPQSSPQVPRSAWTYIRYALAAAIAAVFIYAGVLKVGDPVAFGRDISNFHILPWWIGTRMAFYLPWLEIICGIALFVPRLRIGAVAILTALTAVFIGATIAARVRGIDVNCGCFGSASKDLTFGWHLAIDFAILGALLLLWRWSRPHTR
ncbi:MAG: DoxX family protein [Chthoniobacterales bacterium]|nr:DoxX family protein [Chthoniobacterales bacterium]